MAYTHGIFSFFLVLFFQWEVFSKVVAIDDEDDIHSFVRRLEKSITGKKLVTLIRQKDKIFFNNVFFGKSSFVSFSQSIEGKKIRLVLEKKSNDLLTTASLAHELVHVLNIWGLKREGPISLREFLTREVESETGEYGAIRTECQVMAELGIAKAFLSQCSILEEHGPSLFYRMGEFTEEFLDLLSLKKISQHDFPWISRKDPLFISAHHDRPYPLAIAKEYFRNE